MIRWQKLKDQVSQANQAGVEARIIVEALLCSKSQADFFDLMALAFDFSEQVNSIAYRAADE